MVNRCTSGGARNLDLRLPAVKRCDGGTCRRGREGETCRPACAQESLFALGRRGSAARPVGSTVDLAGRVVVVPVSMVRSVGLSSSRSIARNGCDMVRAVSTITNTSRTSVLASPGCRRRPCASTVRAGRRPGSLDARAAVIGRAPMSATWPTISTSPNFVASFSNRSRSSGSVLGSYSIADGSALLGQGVELLAQVQAENKTYAAGVAQIRVPPGTRAVLVTSCPAVPATPHAGNHVTQTPPPSAVRRCTGPGSRQALISGQAMARRPAAPPGHRIDRG